MKKTCSWLRINDYAIVLPFATSAQDSINFAALHTWPQPGEGINRHTVGKDVVNGSIWKREFAIWAKEEWSTGGNERCHKGSDSIPVNRTRHPFRLLIDHVGFLTFTA